MKPIYQHRTINVRATLGVAVQGWSCASAVPRSAMPDEDRVVVGQKAGATRRTTRSARSGAGNVAMQAFASTIP